MQKKTYIQPETEVFDMKAHGLMETQMEFGTGKASASDFGGDDDEYKDNAKENPLFSWDDYGYNPWDD